MIPPDQSPRIPSATESALRRLLKSGRLEAFPKHPDDLQTVLAIAAGIFHRQRPYAEAEVNDALCDWLTSVNTRLIDHVTMRRYMVDCGFLKRTTDGSRYFLNYGKLASVLGDPVVEIDAGTIAAEINRARDARKRAYARGG